MRRLMQCLSVSLLVLALVAARAAAQDVSGNWTFTIETPTGPLDVQAIFTQDGTAVAGEADFAMAEAIEISDGIYQDGVLTFLLRVGIADQWIDIEVEAKVDGDEMVGEALIPEMGEGTSFTAKRGEGD